MEELQEEVLLCIGERLADTLFPREVYALRVPWRYERFKALRVVPHHFKVQLRKESRRAGPGRSLVKIGGDDARNEQQAVFVHERTELVKHIFVACKVVFIGKVFAVLDDLVHSLLHFKQLFGKRKRFLCFHVFILL